MNTNKLDFIYFGTPEFSVIILDKLKDAGYLPSLVITAPDKPVGRKQIITSPPVKIWAEKHDISCWQPRNPREIIKQIKGQSSQLYIVASYGYLLSKELLDIPNRGVLNVHASLLPKYRGASPIESTLLNGDNKTGSTIMQMTLGMDEGPIVSQSCIPISSNITKPKLFKILAQDGGQLLVKTLPYYLTGTSIIRNQNHKEASYCKKIIKINGDITHDNDALRYRKYRAYYQWPGVFLFDENLRLKITKAEYKNNIFIIQRVIPAGKNEINYEHYLKNKK